MSSTLTGLTAADALAAADLFYLVQGGNSRKATGTQVLAFISANSPGSDTQVLFNDGGAFGGDAGLTYNKTTDTLTMGAGVVSNNGAASTPPLKLTGSWFTGGSSTTTKPQLLVEASGATTTGWDTAGTGLGVNAASGFTGQLLDLQHNGVSSLRYTYFSPDGYIGYRGTLQFQEVGQAPKVGITNTQLRLANGMFAGFAAGNSAANAVDAGWTRKAAANIQQGAADAASPVAQTLSVQNVVAGTSNTAGANWTFSGSQGTGTGAGGSIILKTAPAGGSGTSQNALANALIIDSTGVSNICAATATPAAGSTAARLVFGTTSGFGIYYGSGAPTVSAAQGSIYLRSDGSGVADRLYVNTNGSTTWTNFVTAA